MHIIYGLWGVRKLFLLIQNFIFNLVYSHYFNKRIKIYGFPIIAFKKGSKIMIGKNLVLISSPYFSEPGINHPVILRTISSDAKISIGDNVGISGGSIVAAKEITIGNNVLIGANVLISDTDFHPTTPKNRRYSNEHIGINPVIIEDNVFLGINSIVLKGVRIGKNSVIGAGSIVTSDIPRDSVAVGIPAKIIRTLE